MPQEERNPYAPPAEPVVAFDARDERGGRSDYSSERRPVILCIGLTALTVGLYQTIWLMKRRRFLEGLDASTKLSEGLLIFVLVANILSLVVSFIPDAAPIRPLFSLVSLVGTVIANFRVLNILRSDSARTGRFLRFSTVGTFCFGIYYLQYKINQLADLPAHVSKPKRKKKRMPAPDDAAPLDAEPVDAARIVVQPAADD